MKENLECAIVRDLLPLYQDDVVSETTKRAIQAHLESCDSCRGEQQRFETWKPEEEKQTSSAGFARFRRKVNRKRILTALVAIVLTAAVLISAGVVIHQVPLVDITEQELTVHRVYRYEVEGEPYFIVLFEVPAYTGYTSGKFEVIGDEKSEIGPLTKQLKWKKTLLSKTLDWTSVDFWVFSAEGMNARKEDAPFEQLTFGQSVLWSEADAGADVPEYVYLLHEFYANANGQVRSFFAEGNEIGVFRSDGRRTIWTLDGNVLADDYPDENGRYPNY